MSDRWLPLRSLWASRYRSLRSIRVEFDALTVVVGPNGSGKSNLYRALQLLGRAALGELREALITEGGMPSALWAGPRDRSRPVRITLGVRLDDLCWELECGMGPPDDPFPLDPRVKLETVWHVDVRGRKTRFAERAQGQTRIRNDAGRLVDYPSNFDEAESMLSHVLHPASYPELSEFVHFARRSRFYELLPAHPSAPARSPCTVTRSYELRDDGANFATVWKTLGWEALQQTVAEAFPGWDTEPVDHGESRVGILFRSPHLERPLTLKEISDGMLRYLMLAAALYCPKEARFLAFNEPESSLNESLMPSLARLFHRASRVCQVLVVTHSQALACEIAKLTRAEPIRLRYGDWGTMILDDETSHEPLDDPESDDSNIGDPA